MRRCDITINSNSLTVKMQPGGNPKQLSLHNHLRLDAWVALVIHKLDVLHLETVDIRHGRIELQLRERHRLAAELFFHRIEMFVIDMSVLQRKDAFVRREPRYLRKHMKKQRI